MSGPVFTGQVPPQRGAGRILGEERALVAGRGQQTEQGGQAFLNLAGGRSLGSTVL